MRKLQHTQEVQVIHEEEPWQKNKNQFNKDELKKEFKQDSKKESSIIYYNCNKLCHVKQKCKLPKKHSKYSKKKKKNIMKATWSDSDESSSKEDEEIEEMANLCIMTKQNDSSSDKMKRYMSFILLMNCKMLLMN